MFEGHLTLDDRLEKQYRVFDWAEQEYERIETEKRHRILAELHKNIDPILQKKNTGNPQKDALL